MVRLFVLLLIVCLALFFGLHYVNSTGQEVKVLDVTVAGGGSTQNSAQIQVVLAGGIAFFQFAIVILALLDRIADSFKLIVRPFVVLLPLIGFLLSMYRTFAPLFANFLPQSMVSAVGINTATSMTAWVTNPEFTTGVLITLGAMFLFLLTYKALTAESDEVRALKIELARTKRALR